METDDSVSIAILDRLSYYNNSRFLNDLAILEERVMFLRDVIDLYDPSIEYEKNTVDFLKARLSAAEDDVYVQKFIRFVSQGNVIIANPGAPCHLTMFYKVLRVNKGTLRVCLCNEIGQGCQQPMTIIPPPTSKVWIRRAFRE